jgi:hypothetical protein
MPVQFVSADVVRSLQKRVLDARQQATSVQVVDGDASPERPAYWECVFENNAAAVLAVLPRVRLKPDYVVRYRFYERRGGDLLVRPFVARATTDVETIRQLIDWHPAPDSVAPSLVARPDRDVDLLYRHFEYEASAEGCFEYWIAMQELWASARWIHSTVVADADELRALTSEGEWDMDHPLERCETAVVQEAGIARLAVPVLCRLDRQTITLQQIEIHADQRIEFANAIPIARGPRGYLI